MRYLVILILILLLIVAGCKQVEQRGETVTEKQVEQPIDISLKTQDGPILKATFSPNSDSSKGLILVHQLSMDKSSYSEWISNFQKSHNVLAIDLRGHGESSGNWKEFSDSDFIAMEKDLETAKQFLEKNGITAKDISYIGASIGANTVQNFVSKNEFDKAVLLSPGTTYRGINLNMQDNSVLAIASSEDTFSFNTIKKLKETNKDSEFIFLDNKGHGTNMLDNNLVTSIINYLSS